MSSEGMNILFRVDDYKMAQGADEVNALVAEGYEPYGDPSFVKGNKVNSDGTQEIDAVYHYQAMVHRAPFEPKAYLDAMKGMLLAVTKLQGSNLGELFNEEEREEIEKAFGESIF